MTSSEALKRSEKSQSLKVFRIADSSHYYVESEKNAIAYKVFYQSETEYHCNCGDFAKNSSKDPSHLCKHLLCVINSIREGDAESVHYLERYRPKLDESFIKKIEGKDFVLYSGLLDVAHQKNLCSVDVELIQSPSEENGHTAICKATVKTIDGKVFSDIGDASPISCSTKIAKHLIRMASTRSKARTMRDCCNIHAVSLEEICDLSDVIGEDDNKKIPQAVKSNVRKFQKQAKPVINNNEDQKQEQIPEETKAPVKSNKGNGNGKSKSLPLLSDAQKNAMFNLARRRGFSIDEVESKSREKYGVSVDELTSENAGEFIRILQQAS